MKTKQTNTGVFLTPEQKALWVGLKDCRLAGRKFSIRKREDHEEVDFFCASENLVVEITDHTSFNEGYPTSTTTVKKDRYVLHFPTNRIRIDIGLVLAQIRGHFSNAVIVF